MNEWEVSPDGETAVGTPLPVIADGDVIAVVSPVWSDVDGLRVSIDWQRPTGVEAVTALGDMSIAEAEALAAALRHVARIEEPA